MGAASSAQAMPIMESLSGISTTGTRCDRIFNAVGLGRQMASRIGKKLKHHQSVMHFGTHSVLC
ncbi:MAG: hypothetical protein AB8B99_23020 [Phormidesmis sp.]